jgi:hypothetical protein
MLNLLKGFLEKIIFRQKKAARLPKKRLGDAWRLDVCG